MYEERITFTPLTEESFEVQEARLNHTLAGEPVEDKDVSFEVDRRVRAFIAARRLEDTAEVYGTVLKLVLLEDRPLATRYLGTAAQVVTDRVKADPKFGSDDGRTLVAFAELLTRVDPRGGSFVDHLHRCLRFFPDLGALYKSGQL
jgi:hypothetical protein